MLAVEWFAGRSDSNPVQLSPGYAHCTGVMQSVTSTMTANVAANFILDVDFKHADLQPKQSPMTVSLRRTAVRRPDHNSRYRLRQIAAVICGLVVQPVRADEPEQHEPQIEQILSDLMHEHGIPGLSVAVATENQLCYSHGFGQADVEHDVPATIETRYRTASVAKPMTAVVVMSLMEDGVVDLDAEVQEYCPAYPEKFWPVTSRQLLGHLGGVRHYKTAGEASSTSHFFSLSAALSTFADDPLLHEPGTKYRYTSFGYNLLGSVAEGAGGRTFLELLHEKVLQPSGMSHTVIDDHFAIIPGRTSGYIRATESVLEDLPEGHNLKEGELYNASLHDTSMKIPGGGLLSTAPDLVRFGNALNTGKTAAGRHPAANVDESNDLRRRGNRLWPGVAGRRA